MSILSGAFYQLICAHMKLKDWFYVCDHCPLHLISKRIATGKNRALKQLVSPQRRARQLVLQLQHSVRSLQKATHKSLH